MKIFLAILSALCMFLFAYGGYSFIDSIIGKSTDFVPLIVALVALGVLVLIYVREFKNKDKKKEKKDSKSPMTEESMAARISKRTAIGKAFLALLIVSIAAMFFAFVGIIRGGDIFMNVFFAVYFPALILFIVSSVVCVAVRIPLEKCTMVLQSKGLTVEDLLAEIALGTPAPNGRVVCTSRAIVFEKEALILPYSAIVWIYQTKKHVNGILVESYWNIYTDDGRRFAVKVEPEDMMCIMRENREKFHRSLLLGFGKGQKKDYRRLRKEIKAEGMNPLSRESRNADRKKSGAIVIALLVSLAISALAAVLLTKSVAFSQDVGFNKKCYIEVVAVEPLVWDYDDIYCRCTLASGETAWMVIDDFDYEWFFDPQAEIYDDPGEVRGVTYEEPVRLTGAAAERDEKLAEATEDAKIFKFDDADKNETLASDAEYAYGGVAYSAAVAKDWLVYADIIRIEVDTFTTSSISHPGGLANCKCLLSSGEEVTVKIGIDDYKEYINASASFIESYSYSVAPDPERFATPVRIFGVVSDSETIDFVYADKEAIEEAKSQNLPPVEFSDSALENQKVYATLVSIQPLYTSSNTQLPSVVHHYICRGVCANGETVWIYIAPSDYEEYFSSGDEEIALDHVLLNGSVKSTSIIVGAEETLNSKWLIEFKSIEEK